MLKFCEVIVVYHKIKKGEKMKNKISNALPKVLPDFLISPDDFVEEIKAQRDSILSLVDTLTSDEVKATWENVYEPLEKALSDIWILAETFYHRNSTLLDAEIKKAWKIAEPIIVELSSTLNQHKGMFSTFTAIRNSAEFDSFDEAKKKVVLNILRDAHLSGADLSNEKQEEFKEVSKNLAKAKNQFEENLTDATSGWVKHVTDKKLIEGLSPAVIEKVKNKALEMNKEGWVFTLNQSDYLSVVSYADNRAFREEMYMEFQTRASDQGANAFKYDNTDLMNNVLSLSTQMAKMLGYNNAAEYSLVTKSAETTEDVTTFISNLAKQARPKAEAEKSKILEYAKKDGITEIKAWDKFYYLEKLRQDEYSFSESEVKEYFPVEKVLEGLFTIVDKLYGITLIDRSDDVDLPHSKAKYYNVYHEEVLIGGLYMDLYEREGKRCGAWMDNLVNRMVIGQDVQLPVGMLVCNFGGTHLSHDDVGTLFHEFGHNLNLFTTNIDYADISGVNGVEWDAVEFPSQFFEEWAWDREILLTMLTEHKKTKEPMPAVLIEKMHKARNFDSGLVMLRQTEMAMFDFILFRDYKEGVDDYIYQTLAKVRDSIAILPSPKKDRFAHTFAHIFAGSYSAGYYGYSWADLFVAPAQDLFKKTGMLNSELGTKFMTEVLVRGGSRTMMENYIAFAGEKPDINALYRKLGFIE